METLDLCRQTYNFLPELAEICGIHAGDGYLRSSELDISGSIEEKEYYDGRIKLLFKLLFNTDIKTRYYPSRRTYGFKLYDKKIIEFLHNKMGFPYGSKTLKVRVPKFILSANNLRLYSAFLRGYFDADGCVTFRRQYGGLNPRFRTIYHVYPKVSLSSVSVKLIKDVAFLLRRLGFTYYSGSYRSKRINEHRRYVIQLNGVSKLERWMSLIGSKNSTQLSKYFIWKKFGFCPPGTFLEERERILNGRIDPYQVGLSSNG